MLRGKCVGLKITLEAFTPNRLETLRVEARKELRARRAGYAVRWIEIVPLSKKTTVVRRMPILAGVHPAPG